MNRTRPFRPGEARHVWGLALTLGLSAFGAGCSPAETQGARASTPAEPTPPASPAQAAQPAPPAARPAAQKPYGIEDWWPNQLDLRPLKANALKNDPTDPTFDYAAAFGKLDIDVVKKDIEKVLTTSQDWCHAA